MERIEEFNLPDFGSSISQYLCEPINDQTIHKITYEISLMLDEHVRDNYSDMDSNISISVMQNKFEQSKIDVVPNNLFTLVILNGEYCPPLIVNNNTFETEKFRYEFSEDNESKIYEK